MTTRILSALVALPLVLVPFYLGGWYLSVFVWVVASYAYYEWMRLTKENFIILQTALLSIISAVLWWGTEAEFFTVGKIAILIVSVYGGATLLLTMGKVPSLLGAVFYIYFPCMFLLSLTTGAVHNAEYLLQLTNGNLKIDNSQIFAFVLLLSVFVPVWLADTGALLFGKLIGGAKLAPTISPNKTWAGLGGAIVGANFLNLIAFPFVFTDDSLLRLWGLWVVYASLIGIISQVGDLFMSSVKRKYNVKDTGALMPGHGGLLDRIDGLLMVLLFLPIIYSVIYVIGQ